MKLIAVLYVPGTPVSQPRQRHRVVAGSKPWVQNYTPAKHPVNEYKAAIQRAAKRDGTGVWLLEGPLRVDIVAVFPRQSAKTWKTRPMPRYWHTTKPDRDNVEKAVYDALTGLAWRDDAQICAGQVTKQHAAGGEEPHTLISIWKLEGE